MRRTECACQLLETVVAWTQDWRVVCDQNCGSVAAEIPHYVAFLMAMETVCQKQLSCADYHEMWALYDCLYVERLTDVQLQVEYVVCVKTPVTAVFLDVCQMNHLVLHSVLDCCLIDVSACVPESWHDAVEKVVVCKVTETSYIDIYNHIR